LNLEIRKYLFVIILLAWAGNAWAKRISQPKPAKTRILLIFDASQSMAGFWESDKKINIARRTLIQMIDSLQYIENVELGLRVYGHQSPVPPQDCSDTRLEVPFSKNNASKIRQKLRFLIPKGTTPIAYSLKMSEHDFPKCEDCRNIIVLITDGLEACDGDPCEVSQYLQTKGITLKPYVVGIGYDPEFKKTFECIGHYYNADNEDRLEEVLGVVISQALNTTSAQINLLDSYGNPTETNVSMSFFDKLSGKFMHNFVHTINYRGNPDTIFLDPLVTYRVKIQTVPPVYIDSVKTTPGMHTVFAADAPQGYLHVKAKSGHLMRDMQYIIRKTGEKDALDLKKLGEDQKLLTGNYDIELLSKPRFHIKNVAIAQSTTTTVEVPQAGIVTVLKPSEGFGGVYKVENGELTRILELDEKQLKESFVLMPGNYRLTFRGKNVKQSIYSISRKFTIEPGSSIPLQLF